MKRLLWVICFILSVCGTALANEGLIKPDGTVILPPIYHSIQHDDDGHYRIEKDGCVGWADHTGKIIVPPVWDFVSPFSEGLGLVAHDGLFGYVDEQGNTVIEPQWPLAFSFYKGYAMIAYPLDEKGNIEQSFGATSTWAYYTDERTADLSDVYSLDTWDNCRTIEYLSEPGDSNSPYYAWGVIDYSGNVIVAPTTQNLDAIFAQYAGLDREQQYPSDDSPIEKDWYSTQKKLIIDNENNQILDDQGNVLSDHLKDKQGNALPNTWFRFEPALAEGHFIGYAEQTEPLDFDLYGTEIGQQLFLIRPIEGIATLLPYQSLKVDTDKNCYIGYVKLGADLLSANAEVLYSLPFGRFYHYNDEVLLIDNSLPLSVFKNTEVLTLSQNQILELCSTPTVQDVEPSTGYKRYWYGDKYFVFDQTTLMRFGTTCSYPIKPNVLELFETTAVHRYESYGVVYLAIVTPDRVLLKENFLSFEASDLLEEDKNRFAEQYFPGYSADSIVTYRDYFEDTSGSLLKSNSAYDSDESWNDLNYVLFYQGLCEGSYRYEMRGDAWDVDSTYAAPSDKNWTETLECHGGQFFWDAVISKQ